MVGGDKACVDIIVPVFPILPTPFLISLGDYFIAASCRLAGITCR